MNYAPKQTLVCVFVETLENNIKEARISTLQKIIELGFGGRLELNMKI